MSSNNGEVEIVTGKNDREEHLFSVIVKRSYLISDEGEIRRKNSDHELRKIDAYYDNGDPEWSVVQYEHELAAYKPLVDVVVIGNAHTPDMQPVPFMKVGIEVGSHTKELVVFGDRQCEFRANADPVFSEPQPFAEMAIRYDRAYGGYDEISSTDTPLHYPRNFMGKGVVLYNVKERVDELPLPNIEDPGDLLTPERIIIGEPEKWYLQPIPQGLGWRQRTWYPRSALLGAYPPFTEVGTITPEEQMGWLPENHIALAKQFRLPTQEALYNNGASLGLSFETLEKDEKITLKGLTPGGLLQFRLPGDVPEIALDIGHGEERLNSVLHTVSIRPEENELDLIWRGDLVYEGYGWLNKMQRLHAEVH